MSDRRFSEEIGAPKFLIRVLYTCCPVEDDAHCALGQGECDSSRNERAENIVVPVLKGGLQVLLNTVRWFSKRRIHQHHVIALSAEVNESESVLDIVRKESPFESLTVVGSLSILTECLDYLFLGSLEELSVGDAGQVEKR